ncbi:MAG TPA: hypothetical protein VNK52_03830 [Hyphomicrobiaceae bacterium]|nr:hypothetical protein [Hyphomicrobiaceae bacterium]
MSMNIAQLEQAWLEAETAADAAKREAVRASEELARRNLKVVDAAEIKVLMSNVEQAKQRRDEAEQIASAAFDQLWQAKGQWSVHA